MTNCKLYDKINIVKEKEIKDMSITSLLVIIVVAMLGFNFLKSVIKGAVTITLGLCLAYYLINTFDLMSYLH